MNTSKDIQKDEVKYVTLNEVVEEYKKKHNPNDQVYMKGFDYWANQFGMKDNIVITEDAEFEIIQPKQLPEPK